MPQEYRPTRWTVYDRQSMSVDSSSTRSWTEADAGDDPLADVLGGLRVEGSCYCRTELTAPWGLDFAPCAGVSFHFVAEGSCWFVLDGQSRALQAGDLVVLPAGHPHGLRSRPDVPAAAVLRLPDAIGDRPVSHLRHGGAGSPTLVLCGGTRFTEPHSALVAALPPVLQIGRDASPGPDWIASTMAVMGAEAAHARPGGETVIARLCDVLVIHAVRRWLEDSTAARSGWLGALRDERIGPVLALMHRHPERPWTVASLAAAAHLSRALFAQRFTELVGEPPIGYLTRRRMEVATTLLRQGTTISQAARHAGYGSVAAFSRAYKHFTGAPPSAAARARSA
jgi:AraC-like DNA-binding protein